MVIQKNFPLRYLIYLNNHEKGNLYGPTVEVGNLHGDVRKIAMNHVVKQKLIWMIPACLCLLIFFLIHLIQKIGAFIIPGWGIIVLTIFISAIIFSYSVRLRLLNRIGGEVLFLAVIIIIGMLVPESTVDQYPEQTSLRVSESFDTAWKKIYGKNLFEEFSLHKHLLQYSQSLANFDVHRAGQVGFFSLFGIGLGICFIFPC